MVRPVSVTRALTATPLRKRHELFVRGRAKRGGVEIPWAEFDRSKYPEPALALAADAMRALAVGEYTAVDLFARLVSGLALNGAPLDLISAAARIPEDESRHADLALHLASLLAGTEAKIGFDRDVIEEQLGGPYGIAELDRMMVEVSAIGETLAGALLSACARRATDPVAHALFASIVSDEVHHARLGWYYLSWRAPQWTQADRQRVADQAGAMIARIEVEFSRGRDAPRGAQKAARALGVLETKGQRALIRAVVEDEIVPALDALGLGASHAWRVRQRVAD